LSEYVLVLEPRYPNEAFEALSDAIGINAFTRDEAITAMSAVLGISTANAGSRFDPPRAKRQHQRTNIMKGEFE